MLEIPEAIVISRQLDQTVKGKRIKEVVTAASPHKFAWYFGEPSEYDALLCGRTIEAAFSYGGRIEMPVEDAVLQFGDGVNLRYYEADEKHPAKHQLFVAFDDGSALAATVAMYGMLMAYPPHAMDDDFYYKAAKEAVSPLSDGFDYPYFQTLFDEKGLKMSAKAFLATEQRIPGLGNGVLQDILLNANIHPKKKMRTLSEEQRRELFDSVTSTLAEMTGAGGRDTERDLFGNLGGYQTKLGKNNKLLICPNCGGGVKKESYMGGSIYFCEQCQEK
ncbi:MAG: endonuclease VIII [Oscillospiraceae bacterium]|nr:endonuclease VIII [Oscillospiraceae bacterium]